MIKIFLVLFLVSTIYADDTKFASEIFEKIVSGVVKSENPKIYVHTKIKAISKYKDKFNQVSDCIDADIVLLSTTKDIPVTCRGKILFGTRYSHLRDENVIGSFFWQKGRPNILFYKTRLQSKNIELETSFDKYIED